MAEPALKHDVFQAIADPTRRRMLKLLAGKELPIVAVAEQFTLSRTAINKHLHMLSDAGLVISRRVGRETRYSLHAEPLEEIKDWLGFFESYWDERLALLKDYVESQPE